MRLTLALIALTHIFFGRLLTFRTAKQAWQSSDDESLSLMARINANPSWKLRYRGGQVAYVIGIVLFVGCFFL